MQLKYESDFFDRLSTRLLQTLPAATAHEPLRAIPIGSKLPDFKHALPPKPGSVMILLFEDNGHIRFPLIKRPEYTGAHSGQVSFPGGKAEDGEDPIDTALRECEEEIGVNGKDIHILGRLSEFYVVPSNFMVTPVVARIDYPPIFQPDPHEVAKVMFGNLHDLLQADAVKVRDIVAAGTFQMRAPHFEVEGEVVWGATAMILNELREVLRELLF